MNAESLEGANGRQDMISRLPDEVLCQILSCLSTKDAVCTTILSSRWKYLWTSIYNLCFDDREICRGNEISRTRFLNFVDRVLILCHSSIISFCLLEQDLSHVNAWLRFAIRHNVRRLTLCVHIRSFHSRHRALLRLPPSILTCETLVELRLCNDFVLDIPISAKSFPSLKILRLEFQNPADGILDKFSAGCPVLEVLSIAGSLNCPVRKIFNIIIPTLKKLQISIFMCSQQISDHIFVVRTPNLEYLSIYISSLAYFHVNEMPHLKEAYVNFGAYVMRKIYGITNNIPNWAMDLVSGMNKTKTLTLSPSTMMALSFAFNDNLPTFPNLIHLELKIEPCFRWKLLAPFLHNSPNLQVLILNLGEAHKLSHLVEQIICEDVDWEEPERVPYCLLFCVKVIKIVNIEGKVQLVEVVKYLLQNSKVLEKFMVSFSNSAEVEDLRKEVLISPKGSKTFDFECLQRVPKKIFYSSFT